LFTFEIDLGRLLPVKMLDDRIISRRQRALFRSGLTNSIGKAPSPLI
jgi:hypothetical protein